LANKSKYLISFGLLLLLIYTIWLLKQTSMNQFAPKAEDTSHPDAFAEQVVATHIDKQGKLHSQLISPRIVHYPDHDSSVASNPHVILYNDKDGKNPWHVTALNGKTIDGDTQIILWDNVKIHEPPGNNNDDMTMTTSYLEVYPDKDFAKTDKPVTFSETGVVVKSVGMKAYINEKRVELLSRAQGVYDAEVADANKHK
tara:strand:+ start:8200 stop:8796 length:597 start_codon:yes stop_codon:yes gene_type:complete